jgi:hypothetical protein
MCAYSCSLTAKAVELGSELGAVLGGRLAYVGAIVFVP